MEIYVYNTLNGWYKDKSIEVLEGEVNNLYNGVVAVDTVIDNKRYRQLFSSKNNFAVIYKLSYGFLACAVEINFYFDVDTWKKSKPDISFNGQVCEDECGSNNFVFISEDGYKHHISLDGIYAVTYER